MFWPTSISQSQKLPEVEPLDKLSKSEEHTYKENPHDDEILDILANYTNGLPYVVLTYRSIYLFNWTHKVLVNVHIRSDSSIEKFGSNISVRLSPNQQTYAVKTDKNVILVYTIKATGSDSELLEIYSKNGTLIQNGYPSTEYEVNPLVYGGLNSKFSMNSNDQKNGIVKNIINTFIGVDGNEVPIVDLGLRLKLILNVASPIVEYCFISSMALLLINTNPHAFQVIHLNSTSSVEKDNEKNKDNIGTESNNEINFVLSDELDWFKDPEINNNSEISGMDYNYDLDCFLWFNEQGDALLVKNRGDARFLKLTAICIYKSFNRNNVKAIKGLINHFKNLCYLLLENGDIFIYKLMDDLSCKLLKIIKGCIPSKKPINLYLNPHGDSFVVLYENGWNIFSSLGNQNFSTFEYDHLNISNVKKIQFLSEREMILVNELNNIIFIDLTIYSNGQGYNMLSIKRPVLYDKDKILIFKAYEKKLVDYHHYNYNLDDITNRNTDIWFTEMLPLQFRITNNIRSCCVSDDGNNLCVVGNYDVIIFSILTQKWKFLEIVQDNTSFEKTEISINKCCWWKNYLILGSNKSGKEKKSEVVVFSEKILEENESFGLEFIVWNFNFENTPYDESFLDFNADIYNDILFVMTDKLNCYTFKLILKIDAMDKINGDYNIENGKIHDSSMKTLKSYITFQKSTVYQLRSCFKESDESIVLNYGTILKITNTDLLFLTNTDLYYIKREKEPNTLNYKYVTYLINDCVEYVHQLNNKLICLFDGTQLIHYNLKDDISLLDLKIINVSIGNDFSQDSKAGYIVKYIGTCPYPITTIAYQNIMFGIEIECFNKIKLKLETTRRNYLTDLVNHYILSNASLKVLGNDPNAVNIVTVYEKFSNFKNFKFVLEKLMVDYLQKCYDDNKYDSKNEYFDKLYALIEFTGKSYEIILNCLKKTETQFWPIFFKKSNQTPRFVVNKLFTESDNQRLTAHYFIIMLNYEKYDDSINSYENKNGSTKKDKKDKKNKSSISSSDQDLIINILKKLILTKDFDTSFELFRFLKIVDDKMSHKCLEKMKVYLKN